MRAICFGLALALASLGCGSPAKSGASPAVPIEPDAGSGAQGGPADGGAPDAGAADAGPATAPDGGSALDAGTAADGGSAPDGGTALDGGTAPDGGTALDAGTALDGGTVPDGGPASPARHTLRINVTGSGGGGGRVTGATSWPCEWPSCEQQFDDGQAVHLVAAPEPGFLFDGWTGDCTGAAACELTMSADRQVTATFARIATLAVALNGSGSGRVTSAPGGLDCPGACTLTVKQGTAITLTPAADGGSTFLGWGGSCTGSGVCTVAAKGAQLVWASFEAKAPPPPACAEASAPDTPLVGQFVKNPDYQSGFECGGGTADGSGSVALLLNAWHTDAVFVVDRAGALLGSASTSMGGFLLPQPKGFAEVSGRGYLGPEWVTRYGQMLTDFDSAGAKTGSTFFANHSGSQNLPAAADPNGGVLFAGDFALNPNEAGDPTLHAAILFTGGGSGAGARWGPKALASAGAVFGVGVDVHSRSLVITDGANKFGGGTVSAEWFDAYGTPLTGEFVLLTGFAPGASTWFETTPLIGGGLLVRRMDGPSRSQALAVLGSGSAKVEPPPAWMASRRDVRLQIARGGKAYAVLPLGAEGVPCTQTVEIVAPDGTSCGATNYPIAAGTCDTHDVTLGADGTVIQQLPQSLEETNDVIGGHTCTWRWWTGAAR